MKASAFFTIACFVALSLTIYSQPELHAQVPSPRPQMAGGQDSSSDLFVGVGKTVLVDSARPIKQISVGLGDYAEASAVSPTEVLVNGKAAGDTSLIIWDAGGGRLFFNVRVGASTYAAEDRMEALRRELRAELPGQTIRVSAENGLIFLRGTVKDLNSSNRAAQIAVTFGKVINLLYVDVPPAERQVLLKVRFASVDRSLEKQLCMNIFSTGATNTIGTISTGQCSPPSVSLPSTGSAAAATISNGLNLSIFRPDLNLGVTIQALENTGLVQVLAEPNVIAQNGKEASFLAGGEYPYPVVQGVSGTAAGAVTIQFKEYGIRLNFIPTITPRGTIHLQVAPEVSALDFTNAVEISGFNVPAITVRRMQTEVELAEGQSFAIGGLLDNNETKTFEKIPFLGDIPILGKFFQSIQKTRNNTELIVLVTPEFVDPIPVGAPLPQLKYPDKFLPPNSDIPMHNPDTKTAGATPPPPQPSTMPVEKLIQSMQPEQPLVIENGITPGAGSSGSTQAPAANPTPVLTTAPQ
ncbi:MAG TPA: pilus assembly protein N-terminal domain-containing protein [Silvibacterium sp.]|nr:pilus assembly protein N-terminal domain-containing protein [Silvibacterium sp.]